MKELQEILQTPLKKLKLNMTYGYMISIQDLRMIESEMRSWINILTLQSEKLTKLKFNN